jgi:hypothetical protein
VVSGPLCTAAVGLALPQAGFPVLSLRTSGTVSMAPRGWGCMTLPTVGNCGAAWVTVGAGFAGGAEPEPGPGPDGAVAVDELADDGLDHPGPVVEDR